MFTKNYIEKNYPGSEIVYGDTDSVFIKFDNRNKDGTKMEGIESVFESMKKAKESASLISKQLKPPQNLEFEKCIFPFVLISKKRYHGHYYTSFTNDYYVNSMGIVLKRRDNANIVKYVFGGMIDIIMKKNSIPLAIDFIKTECTKLLNGEFPLSMFIVSKTLKGFYKNKAQIAHAVLADRIGERNPGSKPNSNDRIAYVYINNVNSTLQGDRIETPEFIVENNLQIDYRFYLTNQIMTPCAQILALGIGEEQSLKISSNNKTLFCS